MDARVKTVSIIVPCLNEAAGIVDVLAQLQPMRSRGVEVIVVDGGSSDETVILAQPHADQVIVASRGRAAQMNAGALCARGDVLLFLHADSRLPDNADRLVLDGLTETGKMWGRFDVSIGSRRVLLRIVAALMNTRSRITGIATGDQGIFVARRAFEAVGGYRSIALMEDIALSSDLKRHGRPLCLSPRISTSARRWQKHGVVATILLMWRLRLAYFFGADPDALASRYATHR
jgi:rSAM/selenodomain-associated transferase 2